MLRQPHRNYQRRPPMGGGPPDKLLVYELTREVADRDVADRKERNVGR